MKNIATWIGLIVGLAALILQISLTIPARLANGDSIFGAVIFYFTFYTILSNLMLVLVYASDLWPRESLRWWRSSVTRGMMAGVMILVGLFYHFFLAGTWNPQGWFKVADVTLHYVTPIFFVAWWVLFQWHGKLKFGDIPIMLLPSTVWLIYAMIRGAIVTEYPYPILEAHKLGYGQVAINVVAVLAGVT
ncbi:MAG: Pr6Pr family membrane protein, partial [Devosia sp.]